MAENTGFAPDQPRKNAGWKSDVAGVKASRGKAAVFVLVLMLGLGGAIAGLIFYFTKAPAQPRLESLPVSQYGPRWSHHPWAENSALRLKELFGEDRANKNFGAQQADKFRNWLDFLRAKPAEGIDQPAIVPSEPLLIYLSGFGGVNASGVHILLPKRTQDSKEVALEDTVEWLLIDDLLQALKDCPAKDKMLLLDLAHPIADPFNGILLDDVAEPLCKLLDGLAKEGKLPCPILVSCGPGQHSLPCDPEQMTVFAFYVREGLRGAAKHVIAESSSDELVDAAELARFVQARVARWAKECFGVPQTPMLYANAGANLRFPLSDKLKSAGASTEAPKRPEYPAALTAGWAERSARMAREEPQLFARGTFELLFAEEGWAATGRADRAEEAWRLARQNAVSGKSGSARPPSRDDTLTASAAPAVRNRLPNAPADAKSLEMLDKPLADALIKGTADEESKARQAWAAAAKKAPLDAARKLWEKVLDDGPTEDRLRLWGKALEAVPLPAPRAELLLLARVAREEFRVPGRLAEHPVDALASLFRAEEAARKAAFEPPEDFPAVRALYGEAESLRQAGEAELLSARKSDVARAAALKLDEAAEKFGQAVKLLIARRKLAEQAEAVRVAVMDTLSPAVRHNRPRFADWKGAVESLRKYYDQVSAEEAKAPADPASILAHAEALKDLDRRLLESYQPEPVKKLVIDGPPRTMVAESAALREYLAGPAIRGEQRADLWRMWREDIARYHAEVRKEDQADEQSKKLLDAPESRVGDPQRDVGLRRAEAAAALLALAAFDLSEVESAMKALSPSTVDPVVWVKAGEALRIAWHRHLPAATEAATAKKNWADAERKIRAVPSEMARHGPMTDATPWLDRLARDCEARRRFLLDQLAAGQATRDPANAAAKFYADIQSQRTWRK